MWQYQYNELKESVITDIWSRVKDQDNQTLDITEEKGIPAIVTGNFDDQESETIDELEVKGTKVIALASSYYDGTRDYDLDEFEVPFLIAILDSVEKHIALEDEKKKKKKK